MIDLGTVFCILLSGEQQFLANSEWILSPAAEDLV